MSKSGTVRGHPVTWALRLVWLAVPFTAGTAVGAAVAEASRPVQLSATVGAWVGWAAVAVSLLVLLPVSLTVIRWLTPAAAAVTAIAVAVAGAPGARAWAGLVLVLSAAVLALTGWVADDAVDGASYGDERRYSLRTPGALLLGPVPLVWAAGTAGLVIGPLLLAAGRWAWGALLAVVGTGAAVVAARSLHQLSTRFLVFVPAGVTVVDPLTLADAVLFERRQLTAIGPTVVGSDATDLSGQALGLALTLRSRVEVPLTRRSGRRLADATSTRAVVVTPARPAAVLAEAERRGLPVSRDGVS